MGPWTWRDGREPAEAAGGCRSDGGRGAAGLSLEVGRDTCASGRRATRAAWRLRERAGGCASGLAGAWGYRAAQQAGLLRAHPACGAVRQHEAAKRPAHSSGHHHTQPRPRASSPLAQRAWPDTARVARHSARSSTQTVGRLCEHTAGCVSGQTGWTRLIGQGSVGRSVSSPRGDRFATTADLVPRTPQRNDITQRDTGGPFTQSPQSSLVGAWSGLE
jgi:hypothetical protein